jgi:phospholipid transport system transporter-binding protein
MTQCELKRAANGDYQVLGLMGFETAGGLLENSSRAFHGQPDVRIDLGGVTDVDSAGLALMLKWVSLARQEGREISFSNIPQKLLSMARISDVEELLADHKSPKSSNSSSSNSSSNPSSSR